MTVITFFSSSVNRTALLSPCRQSPMDFESITLATRSHCQLTRAWESHRQLVVHLIHPLCHSTLPEKKSSDRLETSTHPSQCLNNAKLRIAMPMGLAYRQRGDLNPMRAEPNGFLVHHLSHSVTLSVNKWPDGKLNCIGRLTNSWGSFDFIDLLCHCEKKTFMDCEGSEPL